MKKSELIKLLEAIPDDPEVVVDGYEEGLTILANTMVFSDLAKLEEYAPYWSGEYSSLGELGLKEEDLKNFLEIHGDKRFIKVVRLSRFSFKKIKTSEKALELLTKKLTE